MAAKKDFSTIKSGKAATRTATGAVFTTIEKGKDYQGQQDTASPEEQAQRMAELRTQGRKGCHNARLNLAFTPDTLQYLDIMSGVTGMSRTQFLEMVLTQHKEEHMDAYQRAIAITEEMRKNI